MRRVFLAALLAYQLFTVPCQAEPVVHPGDRVVLMGDSEAYLLKWDFPSVLTGVTFVAVPVPGSSVVSWAYGYRQEWGKIAASHPDVVLVSLGANDACSGIGLVRNEAPYLSHFLQRLKLIGPREVVWLGPPKIGAPDGSSGACMASRAAPALEAFSGLVRQAGVRYLDARQIEVSMWDDTLHCSRPQYPGDQRTGCLTWARWVWSEIRP